MCSKCAISSEIHCKCSEIQSRAKNIHCRRFIQVWNDHKKFKNDWNNVKPLVGVILCDIVTIKNIKPEILQIFQKKTSQNELSCLRFKDFQAKRPLLWLESRHSLWQCAHIVHICASWDEEQCCSREFSFSSHQKAIFHFPSA